MSGTCGRKGRVLWSHRPPDCKLEWQTMRKKRQMRSVPAARCRLGQTGRARSDEDESNNDKGIRSHS